MTSPLFSAVALTLFPEMFPGPLRYSLAGKALDKGIWSLQALHIRDFAPDKHKTVDASPYGGGTGMVMKPDVIDSAVEAAKALQPGATVIYFTPRGVPLTQALVERLKNKNLILVCGRFEGIDERVIEHHEMLEISLGDFVLSGGEIAALALLDAVVRLLPGVIGKEEALAQESFSLNRIPMSDPHRETRGNGAGGKNEYDFAGLLEYPHYTRPSLWKDRPVPDVLLSGNHEQISAWRLEQAKKTTRARRPDLINNPLPSLRKRGTGDEQ